MLSAWPELSVHTIHVSRAKLRYADYIVANHCAMLLRTWAELTRIPVFSPIAEKAGYFADHAGTVNRYPNQSGGVWAELGEADEA